MTKTEKFIKKAKAKFGDKFDYSLVNYTTCEEAVDIICATHGKISIQPKNHLRADTGCALCGKESMTAKMRLSWDDVLARLEVAHGKRYNYDKAEYTGMFNPITIVCKDHGPFKMTPTNHEQGQGCRACYLKLPAGQPVPPPKAARDVERKAIVKLSTTTDYSMLSRMKPTRISM